VGKEEEAEHVEEHVEEHARVVVTESEASDTKQYAAAIMVQWVSQTQVARHFRRWAHGS
jgi:hypothetical protein